MSYGSIASLAHNYTLIVKNRPSYMRRRAGGTTFPDFAKLIPGEQYITPLKSCNIVLIYPLKQNGCPETFQGEHLELTMDHSRQALNINKTDLVSSCLQQFHYTPS